MAEAPEGQIGHGVVIERGDGGDPETWTKIGKITEPDYPNPTRELAQVTHTESSGKWHEKISGLRDGGEFAPTLLLLPGSDPYQELWTDFKSDDPKNYRVVSPAGDEAIVVTAYITNLEHETPLEETMHVTPTFEITGEPTLETLV